jgi:nucleoside-diphosphate-sugar epimerase
MRVLITGSSGFLGKHLVKTCLDNGHDVIGMDIKPSNIVAPGFEEHECDITNAEQVNDVVEKSKPDVVVHLAAALAQFVHDQKRLHQINVDGTSNVIEAATKAASKQFIFLSSVEVYGVKVPIPCPETAPLNPACQYGRDKVECEAACKEFMDKGMAVTIFRPPTIAGPGQNEPTLLGQVRDARTGKSLLMPGGGRTRLQMVNVLDVCSAIMLAIGNAEVNGMTFNLGSDDVPAMRDIAIALFKHAGKPVRLTNIPGGFARFIVKLLHPLHLSPVEPQHLEIALRDYIFDASLAKQKLGWIPTKTDVESAIDTYDWFMAENGTNTG